MNCPDCGKEILTSAHICDFKPFKNQVFYPIFSESKQGWECPKCKAVMAPWMYCCINCKGDKGFNPEKTS